MITANRAARLPVATVASLVLAAGAIAVAEIDVARHSETLDAGEGWSIALVLALAGAAGVVSLADRHRVRLRSLVSVPWLFALGGWLLVAALVSADRTTSLAWTLAVWGLATTAIRAQRVGGWTPVAATLGGAFALFMAATGVAAVATDYDLWISDRLFGLSLDANQMARVAGVGVLAGAALVRRAWRNGSPVAPLGIFGGLLVVGGLVAEYLTRSRTGWIALALALLVAALYRFDWRLVMLVAVAAVAVGVFVVPEVADQPLEEIVSRNEAGADLSTVRGRTSTWQESIDLARADPLFGVGPALDDEHFAEAWFDGRINWGARNAHSLWGHLLVIGGVPALLLALGAGLAYVRNRPPHPGPFIDAVVAFLVLDGVTEAVVITPNIAVFGLAAAMAAANPGLPASVDPLGEVGALGADGGRVAMTR
ncbi:MAG: hypothetical protein HKN26_05215 [Acidimicrobiales bacterium]|nr:hypothetical protein [Acidimicrobiales bacterium]